MMCKVRRGAGAGRALLWAVLIVVAAGRALAEPAPATSPPKLTAEGAMEDAPAAVANASDAESARSMARAAYARGQALFSEGHYADAKAAFEEAFAAVPNPIVRLSIAECATRLGDFPVAHEALALYLAERPDAPDRAAVEAKLAALARKPALLLLSSEPRGAQIELDGVPLGIATPSALWITAAEHRVTLTSDGFAAATEVVEPRPGARLPLRLTLAPLSPAKAPAQVASRSKGAGPEVWISAALGGVSLAAGAWLGAMAVAERDRFDHQPTARIADRGERFALFADVAFAVSAVSFITTAVLCISDRAEEPKRAPGNTGPAMRVSAAMWRSGAGVAASGAF